MDSEHLKNELRPAISDLLTKIVPVLVDKLLEAADRTGSNLDNCINLFTEVACETLKSELPHRLAERGANKPANKPKNDVSGFKRGLQRFRSLINRSDSAKPRSHSLQPNVQDLFKQVSVSGAIKHGCLKQMISYDDTTSRLADWDDCLLILRPDQLGHAVAVLELYRPNRPVPEHVIPCPSLKEARKTTFTETAERHDSVLFLRTSSVELLLDAMSFAEMESWLKSIRRYVDLETMDEIQDGLWENREVRMFGDVDRTPVSETDRYISNQPWYHGNMSRHWAATCVVKGGQSWHGTFLVRKSESSADRGYSLTFNCNGRARHLRVDMSPDGSVKLSTFSFTSFPLLLDHFRKNPMPLQSNVDILLTDYVLASDYSDDRRIDRRPLLAAMEDTEQKVRQKLAKNRPLPPLPVPSPSPGDDESSQNCFSPREPAGRATSDEAVSDPFTFMTTPPQLPPPSSRTSCLVDLTTPNESPMADSTAVAAVGNASPGISADGALSPPPNSQLNSQTADAFADYLTPPERNLQTDTLSTTYAVPSVGDEPPLPQRSLPPALPPPQRSLPPPPLTPLLLPTSDPASSAVSHPSNARSATSDDDDNAYRMPATEHLTNSQQVTSAENGSDNVQPLIQRHSTQPIENPYHLSD